MSIQRCVPPVKVPARDFAASAQLFKALGDPHRLAIVATLARAKDEVCACDFTAGLPLEQSTVSHHLRALREAGIVRSRRIGTWVHYRLDGGVAERVRSAIAGLFSSRKGTAA